MWTSWMNNIAARVSKLDGVTSAVRQPRGLNNHSPGLSISWDASKFGITGQEMAHLLDTTEPRIVLSAGGGGRGAQTSGGTGVSITAHMMAPGEDQIVGDRIFQILSTPRPPKTAAPPTVPAGDLSGRWEVHIEFAAGSGDHTFHVKQQGSQLVGTHQGDFVSRDFTGSIAGNEVLIASNVGEVHGAALSYRFEGKLSGDTMSGTLDMGEYLGARWTAKRHLFPGAQTDVG
jgi:D-glucosaminate-6-phosphate ammonia-lyase